MNSNSINKKDIRKFGLVCLVFFGCLCILALWKNKMLPVYVFGALALLGLGFILSPNKLQIVYRGWLKAAFFMNKVVMFLMLALAYYMVITPFAVLKRFFGGAPIKFKPDKSSHSYWIKRSEPLQPKDRYFKRF